MLVRDVPNRWLRLDSAFNESQRTIDQEAIGLIPSMAGIFTDVTIGMPRFVRFKQRLLDTHQAAYNVGLRSYHGRDFWGYEKPGTEGFNSCYLDPRYYVQLLVEIHTEAKAIQDLVCPDGRIRTMCHFESHVDDPTFGPTREEIGLWDPHVKRLIARMAGDAVMFLRRLGFDQLDLGLPGYGRNEFGGAFRRLSKLQWPGPKTYRLKGGVTHPYAGCRFWTTWVRPAGFIHDDLPADRQPLTATEALAMQVPDDTRDWGLFASFFQRNQCLRELAAAW